MLQMTAKRWAVGALVLALALLPAYRKEPPAEQGRAGQAATSEACVRATPGPVPLTVEVPPPRVPVAHASGLVGRVVGRPCLLLELQACD